jgi:hypothetical protein
VGTHLVIHKTRGSGCTVGQSRAQEGTAGRQGTWIRVIPGKLSLLPFACTPELPSLNLILPEHTDHQFWPSQYPTQNRMVS